MNMDLIGTIAAEQDPPGIDAERWIELIGTHERLVPLNPVAGMNPFTKEPIAMPAHPTSAFVLCGDERVGMLSWAQNGASEIDVHGDLAQVANVAHELADLLGGRFRTLKELGWE